MGGEVGDMDVVCVGGEVGGMDVVCVCVENPSGRMLRLGH